MKLFVEALARIRTQLDTVPHAQAHQASQVDPKLSESHFLSRLVDDGGLEVVGDGNANGP